MFLVSSEYGKGISKEAIYTQSGKQLIVPVPLEKLEKIRFDEKQDYFVLRANGRKMTIVERFDLNKREEVENYLDLYKNQ